MRFYKTDKWVTYTSEDHEMNNLWEEWDKEYAKYFDVIKDKLPKGFIKLYYSNYGFHDFIISNISVQNKWPNKIRIDIELHSDYPMAKKGGKVISLTYRGVNHYSMVAPEGKQWSSKNMQWLTSEFYLHDNGLWSHRIMCDGNCELVVFFKNISIKKIQRQSNS